MHMRQALQAARNETGLTQREVAELVGVSKSSYAKIEAGKRNPSLSVLQRIADLFDQPVEALFFGYPCDRKCPPPTPSIPAHGGAGEVSKRD